MGDVKIEIKEATMDVCKIIDKLQDGLLSGLSKPEEMPLQEAKEISDMIKDMTEAKEKLVKAIYYEKITEAMEEAEYGEDYDEDGPMERSGYRGRNPRTGRYTSRNMAGYPGPLIYDPVDNYRMGYRDGMENQRINESDRSYSMNNSNGTNGMNSGNKNYTPSRHGMAYDNYQTARRYYTENPSEENKMHMKASWDDAVDDAIQALKKMYMEAEPTMKRKVNEKVSRALQEMPPA